jgi:predicted site-specific integrase-resolvase
MPVIRRKLASPPAPTTHQRGMNVKVAARYLGVSTWQIRKFYREGVLKPFRIGNKQMVDRLDLDALIERLKALAVTC